MDRVTGLGRAMFAALGLMIGGVLASSMGAVWADTENGDGGDAEGGDVAVVCDRAPKRCWGLGEARDLATSPRLASAMCSGCSSPVTRRPC